MIGEIALAGTGLRTKVGRWLSKAGQVASAPRGLVQAIIHDIGIDHWGTNSAKYRGRDGFYVSSSVAEQWQPIEPEVVSR
jgi:hypothetical protein